MNCQHGFNLQHKRCIDCEDIAKMEAEKMKRDPSKEWAECSAKVARDQIVIPEIPALNLDNLEQQFCEHVSLVDRFVELTADAKNELAVAEKNLEEIDARIKHDIRRKPEEFEVEKVTEGSVQDALIKTDEHKKATEADIDAKHQVDLLTGKMTVLAHRKSALENCVSLLLGGFFATPKPKAETRDEMKHRSKVRDKERRQR